ncbi:MAG: hypothetical protein IJ637_09345 [Prevotella sp.]|nr:hypothetical protein [Prevotella sp.]
MNAKKYIIIMLLLVVHSALQAQQFTLSGKVIDEDGNALIPMSLMTLPQPGKEETAP